MKSNYNINSQAVVFIICLFIALLFWIITALSKINTGTVSIPVIYKNVPFRFYTENPLPAEIAVSVESKGFNLLSNDFAARNKELIIDFNAPFFRNVDFSRHISVSVEKMVQQFMDVSGDGFRIIKVSPDSIDFDYSEKSTVRVPVQLNAVLHFKKQYFQIAPAILKPDSVELAGSSDLVQKITAVQTQKVLYDNVENNLFFSVSLINPLNDKIILSDIKIWVMVPVEEFTEGKSVIPITNIYYENKPVTLIPNNITITWHASLSNFSQIEPVNFTAEIMQPAISINKKENMLKVKLTKFPKAVQIISLQPEWVDYLIEK